VEGGGAGNGEEGSYEQGKQRVAVMHDRREKS
jgi:hypothetical protein